MSDPQKNWKWSESRKAWYTVDSKGHRRYVSRSDSGNPGGPGGSSSRQTQPSVPSTSLNSYEGPSGMSEIANALGRMDIASPFQVRNADFFRQGRVFATARRDYSNNLDSRATALLEIPADQDATHGYKGPGQIYVVIKQNAGSIDHAYCLLVNTYNRLGVAKEGVVKADHGIIYSGRQEPQPRQNELPARGEEGMFDVALKVNMDLPSQKLDPMSRIDYRTIRRFPKHLEVHNLGVVHENSMAFLTGQLQAVQSRIRHEAGETDGDSGDADEGRDEGSADRSRFAIQSQQAKNGYRILRAQGSTKNQAVQSLAAMLRQQNTDLSPEDAMAQVLGRLRYPPDPVEI
ncbi:hypothetical protein AC578_7522 [Pseudocercospora eumusae]|uniref:DUF6590 domain-containing protein n=1 Tax=Pseudocercospora eumusae TaxID=321146 RepID=A0A139GWQ3_9PEZI|nr:hypothetical protein AC578_7522 [Pseudocercospora eumusae]